MRADGASLRIERIVDELHVAMPVIADLVGELDVDRIGRGARRSALPLLRLAQIFEVEALRPVEGEPDRIERNDGGEQGLPVDHLIAQRHALVRHPARHRRAHRREAIVEARVDRIRLRRLQAGGSGTHGSLVILQLFLADCLHLDQLGRARGHRSGVDQRRARARHLCDRLVQRGLVGARIDDEERLAFLHVLPVAEQDLGYHAGDAGAQIDALGRLEPADIFVPVDHVARQRRGDGNVRSGRGGPLLIAFGTCRQQCQQGNGGDGTAHPGPHSVTLQPSLATIRNTLEARHRRSWPRHGSSTHSINPCQAFA